MSSQSEASQVVGWIAVVVTLLYFSSTILFVWRIVQKRSTEGLNIHNFVGMMLNCGLWSMYGLRAGIAQVYVTNGVAILIALAGLLTFIAFAAAPEEKRYNIGISAASIILGILGGGLIAFLPHDKDIAEKVVGFVAMAANIFMYGAPLTLIATMVRTKDVRSLSFPTMVAGTITTALWIALACLLNPLNVYILVPNSMGMVLFIVQFVLFGLFHNENHEDEHEKVKLGP